MVQCIESWKTCWKPLFRGLRTYQTERDLQPSFGENRGCSDAKSRGSKATQCWSKETDDCEKPPGNKPKSNPSETFARPQGPNNTQVVWGHGYRIAAKKGKPKGEKLGCD